MFRYKALQGAWRCTVRQNEARSVRAVGPRRLRIGDGSQLVLQILGQLRVQQLLMEGALGRHRRFPDLHEQTR